MGRLRAFFCLLFFWAAHLGTLLALCAAALPRLAPEFSGPQALFLACYRDPYLHSLLPLDDCLLWVRNLSMCAALGTAAASFSFQRRMGRRAFAILPLAALSALCFPLPMGSFEFGGPAEFLRPYLYDGIFYSADGLPSVLGPVLLFVSLCALAASLCQIFEEGSPMKNESWFPLGIPWKQERFLLWTGLLLSAGAGLVLFLCQYLPARRALYGYNGTMGPDGAMVRVLLPGTLVPPFPSLLYGPLLCFLALALSLAGVAVYHFLCHYQGGRSIYRMRLLPQFGELWRRCLSAPALALLLGALRPSLVWLAFLLSEGAACLTALLLYRRTARGRLAGMEE